MDFTFERKDMHPFCSATSTYEILQDATVHLHHVHASKLSSFGDALYEFLFLRDAAEMDSGDMWKDLSLKLKSYYFNLRSAPVPGSLEPALPEGTLGLLEKGVRQICQTHSYLQEEAKSLQREVRELVRSDENPLLDVIKPYMKDGAEKKAILLKSGRLKTETEEILHRALPGACPKVLSLSEKHRNRTFESLLIPGRPGWFSGTDLFHAPYARKTHVFTLDGYRDHIQIEPEFPHAHTGPLPDVVSDPLDRSPRPYGEDEDFLEPSSEWGLILEAISGSGSTGNGDEQVEARPYLLEDSHAVLLPADPGHSVMSLQLAGEAVEAERIDVEKLSAGDFLLLRTEGGGSLISKVADQLLGDKADTVHQQKEDWKKRLRSLIRQEGLNSIAEHLTELGAPTANPTNVRNWSSEDTIRPANRRDFDCIMKLIGLEDRADEYWDHMRMITNAHRRAGHRIRDRLLKETKEIEPERVERRGRIDFKLSEREGGTITAFRIHDIASDTYTVSRHDLNIPFTEGEL